MKTKRGMGYGLLLLSGLFLWNPIVGMVDVLPDLIGYILLLAGLSQIADLQGEIGEAREKFRAVAWVALGEAAAQLFIRFFLSATTSSGDVYGQNTPTWILLFSFVVTVLECYFLIPAYRELFRGLGRLAERKEAEHLTGKPSAKSRYDRMTVFAVVFVIGKNLLSLLPEFAALSTYAYYQSETVSADWYTYIRVIRLLALLPALLLTAWWLARWIGLFASAKKDAAFQDSLAEEYETTVAPNRGLLLGRKVQLSFLFARLGAALLPTFMLLWEGVGETRRFGAELLPDFAACGFLLLSIHLLGVFDRIRKSEIWVGALSVAAGIAEWVLCIAYYQRFSSLDARYLKDAHQSMTILTVATIVSAALTTALFVLFLVRILRLTRNELGAGDASVLKDFRVRFGWLFFLLAAITAGKIADRILRPWTNWVWWIPLLLTVVFVLVLSSVFVDLSEGLAGRYPQNPEKQKTE